MKRFTHRALAPFEGFEQTAAVLFVVLLFVCLTGNAQSSADVHITPSEPPEEGIENGLHDIPPALFSVQVDLVLVPVSVTDAANRPVTGLSKENFAIYEDERQQHIGYFSAEDSPISVGILLDVSGTMSNKIDAAREALADFFKNSHPDDDYFVITFSDRPQLVANSTKSIGDIQGKLSTVKPFGYTALLDAIHMGLAKLRSARYPRRALLIISDGGDNSSRRKMREIKSEVEEADVQVYAIGLFDDGIPVLKSLDEKLGKRVLSEVTDASGGRTITVENLAKLPEVARTISIEMRNRYLLGYRPTKAVRDGRWHKIKVRVGSSSATGHEKGRLYPAYRKGYIAR